MQTLTFTFHIYVTPIYAITYLMLRWQNSFIAWENAEATFHAALERTHDDSGEESTVR